MGGTRASGAWKRGSNLIDSLLSPKHACSSSLSADEIVGLMEVRRLLESKSIEENAIPAEIIPRRGGGGSFRIKSASSSSKKNGQNSICKYLAMEFGGFGGTVDLKSTVTNIRNSLGFIKHAISFSKTSKAYNQYGKSVMEDAKLHLPFEWFNFDDSERRQICRLLSYDELTKWGYNLLELNTATRGQPLLFVGWAILCAPHAQRAMARHLGLPIPMEPKTKSEITLTNTAVILKIEKPSYDFVEEFSLGPEVMCNFLRAVEVRYIKTLPYHNNVHGADVLQTTFSLLKMGGDRYADGMLDLYGVLIAAACHDVRHPGLNNVYQVTSHSDLAITYNNQSVLESMHAAETMRLLKEAAGYKVDNNDYGEEKDRDDIAKQATNHGILDFEKNKVRNMNILDGFLPDKVAHFRKVVVESILNTDMSKHFGCVAKFRSVLNDVPVDENGNPSTRSINDLVKLFAPDHREGPPVSSALLFILHSADISNPAKPELFVHWADAVLAEFFAQGDQETREDLDVSPMCNRKDTDRCDSQIGFIKFIIRPTFTLLSELIPGAADAGILNNLEDNLRYWEDLKASELLEPTLKELELAGGGRTVTAVGIMPATDENVKRDDDEPQSRLDT